MYTNVTAFVMYICIQFNFTIFVEIGLLFIQEISNFSLFELGKFDDWMK